MLDNFSQSMPYISLWQFGRMSFVRLFENWDDDPTNVYSMMAKKRQ
jgi:hypothetical protein